MYGTKSRKTTLEERIQIVDDQGWAYQMKAYSQKLKEHNIFQSMSRKGNCIDNSPIENFFGILKQEIYYGNIFRSYEELEQAIIDFIYYYNHERMKEKLKWMSPIEYRTRHRLQEQAAYATTIKP